MLAASSGDSWRRWREEAASRKHRPWRQQRAAAPGGDEGSRRPLGGWSGQRGCDSRGKSASRRSGVAPCRQQGGGENRDAPLRQRPPIHRRHTVGAAALFGGDRREKRMWKGSSRPRRRGIEEGDGAQLNSGNRPRWRRVAMTSAGRGHRPRVGCERVGLTTQHAAPAKPHRTRRPQRPTGSCRARATNRQATTSVAPGLSVMHQYEHAA